MDGTIDCLASHHLPHEYDSKVLEFRICQIWNDRARDTYGVINTASAEEQSARMCWWVCWLSIPAGFRAPLPLRYRLVCLPV